jgi:predicted RNA methylase
MRRKGRITVNDLIKRSTILEIEGYRNAALAKYADAFSALVEAQRLAAHAAPSQSCRSMDEAAREQLIPRWSDGDWEKRQPKFIEAIRRQTDRAVWTHLVDGYGLEKLMDRTARDAFREQLEKNPPEATAENCHATLSALIADADNIFKRGIATAFAKLDRRFRSHDGFKIGARIVLSSAFSEYGHWNHYRNHDETLRDIERVFCRLDNVEHPDRAAGIVGEIDSHRRGFHASAFVAENAYFRVRVFQNGNAHIWFKRDDLVEKVNKLLAEYYGEALGVGADAAETPNEPNRTPAKNFGYFPTPQPVVERAMYYADIGAGMSVLEPSAGNGALARAAADKGADVACIEIQHHLAAELRQAMRYAVVEGDFFDQTPAKIGKFDRILMNPPFDGQRDIDHVMHALQFLKEGGRLVAIMSAGAEFRENTKALKFRAEVEKRGGKFHDLLAGSFASVGTMVNTVMLVIP